MFINIVFEGFSSLWENQMIKRVDVGGIFEEVCVRIFFFLDLSVSSLFDI